MTEEAAIYALLERFETAIQNKDADAAVECYADDVVAYDLAPPLAFGPEAMRDPAGLREWFETWNGSIGTDGSDPVLKLDGNLACIWSLRHMTGTKRDGEQVDLWFRSMVVLTKQNGAWRITHAHNSVPFAMDGSGRALLDLKP